MLRKLTIFIVFVLVGLATFLAGYLFSRKADNTGQQALIDNSLVSRFAQTQEKYAKPTGLFALTMGEASYPTLSGDGKNVWYYIPQNGEIRSVSIQNTLTGSTLIAKIRPNATNISWGANKTLAANYSTGAIYYDLNSNFSKKYDIKVKNPVLSKAGTEIAYNYFDENTGEGNISIADPKLESFKNILATRFANWQIGWLNDSKLILTKPQTVDNNPGSVFILDTVEKTLQNILELKNNLEVAWSPNGQKIIYSYSDPSTKQNGLYFMDIADKNEVPLNLDFDASKCVWSIDNKNVYCAGIDSFVYFDATADSVKTQTVANSQDADPSSSANLFLTSTEDYLLFKNTKDGRLYGLSLSQ